MILIIIIITTTIHILYVNRYTNNDVIWRHLTVCSFTITYWWLISDESSPAHTYIRLRDEYYKRGIQTTDTSTPPTSPLPSTPTLELLHIFTPLHNTHSRLHNKLYPLPIPLRLPYIITQLIGSSSLHTTTHPLHSSRLNFPTTPPTADKCADY